jgi:hypothetical protein
MGKAKPFSIAKKEVWHAYKRVRINKGSAGVDTTLHLEVVNNTGSVTRWSPDRTRQGNTAGWRY